MLSHDDNSRITRVGPGTPMGTLMRQYWVPALLSSELPEADGNPVRVMLLGEKLIAFRSSSGKVGLLPNQCPHRGASRFFGRNVEDGLRCVYHGWKFDVGGHCVDMPNEPADSDFKHKLRPVGYPCVEAGGLVWTYMGDRTEPPPLPAFEPLQAPAEEQRAFVFQRECNWLQALEGDIDTSHFGFLHVGHADEEDAVEDSFLRYTIEDRAPRYKVLDTPFGATYGAYRPVRDGTDLYWRIAHFLFPFYTMVPTGVLGTKAGVRAWVPMDDYHTLGFHTGIEAEGLVPEFPIDRSYVPNDTGWFERFRLHENQLRDHGLDRDLQRNGSSYTGLASVPVEDQAITESMGPVLDRSQEHLGTSDMMVIKVRRRLLRAVAALEAEGESPPGVDEPDVYQQRAGGVVLPKDADWIEATRELREVGRRHPELDPAKGSGDQWVGSV